MSDQVLEYERDQWFDALVEAGNAAATESTSGIGSGATGTGGTPGLSPVQVSTLADIVRNMVTETTTLSDVSLMRPRLHTSHFPWNQLVRRQLTFTFAAGVSNAVSVPTGRERLGARHEEHHNHAGPVVKACP